MYPTRGPCFSGPPQNPPNIYRLARMSSCQLECQKQKFSLETLKKSGRVAEIVGKLPTWIGSKLSSMCFFCQYKLCTRISLLGWILKEIMWLGWILKCVFGGISCDAWEACLRLVKCDMFHGRKLSCDIGGLCVGVIQTDWSPPEWWIAKPPDGS